MTRALLLVPLAFVPFAPVNGQPAQPPTTPASPVMPAGYYQTKLNGHTFTLPVGFTIELAAGADVVPRPIAAALDEKGRLYVTDSSGSNEKVADQLAKKPHRVLRLEDADGDGRYEKSTVYVPNIMFPEGAMWLNGSLYVAAPPHILKFTDTDDDGRADKEEVWFDGKTLTGCANDLHGPYLGPDGWIYWCKGAFAKQEHVLGEDERQRKLVTRAAHIFRARPDGSDRNVVMTGGMDNPVDVVFTPTGDRIFSCTFLQHPRDGKRDGLIHAVYGGVYGKPHDVLDGHVRTGPELMAPMTHLGPAAPSGLHRYESDQFGPDYANNLFCCQFNLRKVSRHVLVPTGSTYTTKDSDFVVSDSHDFHPTDVIEDADGSLLIIDTGGWYKLCCPTSQLVKPDVTGAVYRVKRTGAHRIDDPRGAKIDYAKRDEGALGLLLHDPRPWVVRRAVAEAERRHRIVDVAVAGLTAGGTRAGRLAAVWLAGREDRVAWTPLITSLVSSPDEDIRQAVLHILGLNFPDSDYAIDPAIIRLTDPSPRVRRVAAEALALHSKKVITLEPFLFPALADGETDRPLDHALTYALIAQGRRDETAKALSHPSPRVRRAVHTALDQMPDGKLDPAAVLRELDAKDAALQETAWWVAGRHPEWGDRLAGYFETRLAWVNAMTPSERDALVGRSVPFLKVESVRRVVGTALARAETAPAQRAVLRSMVRAGLKAFPPEWKDGVHHALNSRDPEVVRDAAAVLRAAQPADAIAAWLLNETTHYREQHNIPTPPELALTLRAMTPFSARLSAAQAGEVIPSLHRDRPGPVRSAAADLLTREPLPAEALVQLAGSLKTVPPAEVGKLLPAFDRSTDAKAGLALVEALADPAVRSVVRAEQVKPTLDKYPAAVKTAAEKLYVTLAEARRDDLARLDQLMKSLPAGDVRRGQAVFNGAKGQCAACHKIGYVGGLVGPDLTRIGGIRSERDLLEAVVFPSASFVRSYEPVRVVTADGRVLNGILAKDAPDEIVVVTGADKSERVARGEVESIAPGTVSVMPAGLDQQLARQELADLVAFLRACR